MLPFHERIAEDLRREAASGISDTDMIRMGVTAPVLAGRDALVARVASCRATYCEARADIGRANRGFIRDGAGRVVLFTRPRFSAAEDRAAARRHAMRAFNRARANLRRAEASLAAFEAPVAGPVSLPLAA